MATETVTNGSDDPNAVGSLRYELGHAQAGDVVNFAPGVTNVALAATLTISQNVTIDGGSAVTVSGGGSNGGFSDFTIAQGVHATLDGLTISNGAFAGQDQTNAAVSPTQGGSGGGAITDYGILTLGHSTISGNSATGGKGSDALATMNFSKGGGAGGSAAGGIYVAAGGELDLAGRTNVFARNTAAGGHGGQGGYGFYAFGGAGGAGAYARTLYARGPSTNRKGGHGHRGEGYGTSNSSKRAAGLGGRGGQPGQNGKIYTVYVDAGYGKQETGSGGGGGGGNAFSDFGGTGTVRHVAATRSAPSTVSRAATVSHTATVSRTAIAASPACFTPGTMISTRRGDVAVETLRVGDLVTTASGDTRPIRWIGHRDLDCATELVPSATWPIRIAASAFGCDLPARDLLLSPGHPVLVGARDDEGGMLVPIMCLINGTTICREPVMRVTYWHVELDAHDILLAEGLPAESYFEWSDRAFFEAGSRDALQNPDLVAAEASGRCRPVAIDGALVEAERRRLDTIFVARLAAASAWPDESMADLSRGISG